ncbi:MAG: 6-phosphogluconolactonase [Cytophagaceae bacterium]|nr:6-phosphogluconolactonase [Cytophagaceae bacterium]|tara:strand:+ start:1383 stop:2096 length:714 start_codon:yes stop_codon:yes gene_type:complete
MELKIFKDKITVAKEFCDFFVDLLKAKEGLTVALSGGSTPKVVFDYLAGHDTAIDWSKVKFFWGDERCVPPTDEESNYKMTVEHLFSKINVPEENIFRIKGEADPEVEAERYANILNDKLPLAKGIPYFDLVILGMGDDGHTASVFPHQIELWRANKNCVVATHPDSGQKRVSITGKVINNANTVVFLVTGAGKAEKVEEILNKEEGYEQYPASLVNPDSQQLVWFMDKAAAEKLSK